MNDSNTAEDLQAGVEAGQYLTFRLDAETYGIDILSVYGIQVWETITPLPNTPEHLIGVINLRGSIVPIVDLKRYFGIGVCEPGPMTVLVIVRIVDQEQTRTIGIVADAVETVCDITDDQRRETTGVNERIDGDAIEGLAEVDGRMIILLDIGRLLVTALPGRLGDERQQSGNTA